MELGKKIICSPVFQQNGKIGPNAIFPIFNSSFVNRGRGFLAFVSGPF
jgi:hypothetical protein